MKRGAWTKAAALSAIIGLTMPALSAQSGAKPAAGKPAAAKPVALPPKLEGYKKEVAADVDGMAVFTQQMNDKVFSFGELGFQEFETSKYLTDILKQNGFTIQENLAGIPTAWMATLGIGKPVIALGSDIDYIPQASQKPGVAWHEPIIEGAPGHGEGHNSGMPLQDRRGARREEGHGAAAPAGHAEAVAGRRRGTARHQGVLRPRRRLQGRRHLHLRARRREHERRAGATAAATAWCRSSTTSRARARTPPARRGAAARRSTPSS